MSALPPGAFVRDEVMIRESRAHMASRATRLGVKGGHVVRGDAYRWTFNFRLELRLLMVTDFR